jgi:hypothetical protein
VTTHFKNKTLTVFLAATVGCLGLHRFYLKGTRSWPGWAYFICFTGFLGAGLSIAERDPAFGYHMPYDIFQPGILLAALPMLVAFLEAIVLGLTPDARFDQRFNSGAQQHNHSGGLVVTLVALSLGIGSTLMTIVLAVDIEAAVEALPHKTLDQPN